MNLLETAVVSVVGLIVVYIIIATPESLAHNSWYMDIMRVYRLESDQSLRVISYNHKSIDGALIAHRLRSNKLPNKFKGFLKLIINMR